GLVDALQKRLDAVEKRSGMEARLILDGDIHCEDEIADQYYRIAQEALNNVLKHAQADEVTVYLRAENGIMGLEVADNGRGFDLAEARKSGGLGLKTMQERSEQINGDFEITTAPNQGTKVMVQVNQSHE
ncbi:MAG: ATP-binding protein, partial [Anaerolineaceae bacterium]